MIHHLLLAHQDNTLAEEHHMAGHLYYHHSKSLSHKRQESWKTIWKRQWILNHQMKGLLDQLVPLAKQNGIDLTVLKGMALLPQVYPDFGSRNLSDMDLLLPTNQLDQFCHLILDHLPAELIPVNKWAGDHFKRVLVVEGEVASLTVELHSELFWHLHHQVKWERRFLPELNAHVLDHEDQLVHLMGHWIFQHNFLKLFWAKDVDLYLRHYSQEIDWEKVYRRAEECQLVKSLQMGLWVLHHYFSTPLPSKVERIFRYEGGASWKRWVTTAFLLNRQQAGVRKYVVKHLTKDRLWDAFKYDILWAKNGVEKLFHRSTRP